MIMATSSDSECSSPSYFSNNDDVDELQVLEDDNEEDVEHLEYVGPYMHEPDADDCEELVPEIEDRQSWKLDGGRLNEWCSCGNCQPMASAAECVCCKELDKIADKIAEGEEFHAIKLKCICDHPGINSVCLDPYVLQVAWLNYKQQYGGKAFEGPQDVKYRHIGYRQLVRWCWDYLGRENRVVLPACAVSCIRAHFPPPGNEEDYNFKGFRQIVRRLPHLR